MGRRTPNGDGCRRRCPAYMRYLVMRINCMVSGHDWRETSGPQGMYDRCWRCYLERHATQHSHSLTQQG